MFLPGLLYSLYHIEVQRFSTALCQYLFAMFTDALQSRESPVLVSILLLLSPLQLSMNYFAYEL